MAPSSHNTQPWFFRLSEFSINMFADRTRALPVNDPDDRELTISCGCALMNIRVAAASDLPGVRVELFPEPEETDFLARVSHSEESDASPEEAQLVEFIEIRRTYRKRFASREVMTPTVGHLINAATREGAQLRILDKETTEKIAELVAEGDAMQWANPSWRRELAAWMRPRRRGDGLTIPAIAAPVARLIVRTFDMGDRIGAKDRELAEGAPLVAVLGTESDRPRDWLLAGQALQRVLLVACQHGLQASYLNQPIQVASLRSRLQALMGAGAPQILLRLGYPLEEMAPAPRRALENVIE